MGTGDAGLSWGGSRSRRRAGVAAAVTALVMPLSSVALAGSASAATSVTPGTVALGTDVAGAPTTYSIPFTTSASGSLANGNTITFVAPNGTAFPACSGLSCSNYTLNGSSTLTVSGVALSKVGGSSTNNQVVITLGLLGSVAGNAAATVSINGVGNPTVASTSYVMAESTSKDTAAANSPAYTIVHAAASQVAVVSGSGQSTPVGTTFSQPLVAAIEDQYGNPAPPASPDNVAFNVSAAAPGAASAAYPGGATTDTEPTDGSGQATTSLALTANSVAGNFTVVASVPGLASATFDLTNVPAEVTPGSVNISDPIDGANGVTYEIPFQVSAGGGLAPGGTITLTFPAGTTVPSDSSDYSVSTDAGGVGVASVAVTGSTVVLTVSTGIADAAPVTVTVSNVSNSPTTGTYQLQEQTSVDTVPASSPPFQLSAGPDNASNIVVVSGANQQTVVSNPFASPLVAQVTDPQGKPVVGLTVTFSTPPSDPTASFDPCPGGNPTPQECVVTTDSSGDATSSALTAGAGPGAFQALATVTSLPSAAFGLVNRESGYYMVGSDGGVFPFGGAPFRGSLGAIHLNKPIVGMASVPGGNGYYLVASDGGVFDFGVPFHGSLGAIHLNKPIVAMAVDPTTGGYWLVASDGGIFNFGGARFWGSLGAIHLNKPIVGMAATAEGGYYLVASDGGIFPFGPGTPFYGSTGNVPLNAPIVGMAVAADGDGYYLVASDGGIFPFGNGAIFFGSAGGAPLNSPVIGMTIDPATAGYWLVAADGGVFNFGAPFYGSEGATRLNAPIVAATASG